jgi:hypothetical protein
VTFLRVCSGARCQATLRASVSEYSLVVTNEQLLLQSDSAMQAAEIARQARLAWRTRTGVGRLDIKRLAAIKVGGSRSRAARETWQLV